LAKQEIWRRDPRRQVSRILVADGLIGLRQ